MATKKKTTTAKKNELNESVEQVKSAVSKVNEQITDTASKVAKDIYSNGEQWVENTRNTVKETVAKINVEDSYNAVKEIAGKANKYATETAEELVDGAITTGEQWQKITAKAIKGGLELAAKQQDIVFTTLEEVKDQVIESTKRTRKLFKK